MTVTIPLTQGVFYDIVIQYKELQYDAKFAFEWLSPSRSREVVPPIYLYYS
jgi:hypothetical protein